MRQAGSATIESSPRTEPSRPELSWARPGTIFIAVFGVAAIIYSYRLGADALGGSEAFSAWSAAKPGIGAIARTPVLDEPGKFLFYYGALHYYTRIFGLSEISLRSMSVVLSLSTLILVYAIGCEMFDDNTALAAAAMWAFNPLAVVFAHTARMYPMILTLALAQLLMFWRMRTRPSASLAVLCGVAGSALLYTHLAGSLFIGAALAMLVRDYARGLRNPMPWLAMAVTLALFVPYVPVLRAQSATMISGHWLDWIGSKYEYPLSIKIAAAIGAAAVAAWFVFGGTVRWDRDETLRWLGDWTLLPGLALLAGSIVVHPMFNLRYVAPSLATLALILAAGIARVSVKWRNLTAAGFALVCLILTPYARTKPQPWREMAAQVAAGGAAEPVFFEAGFVSNDAASNVPNGGFPFGFYSVPFDYYFKGANPRIVVPGFDDAAARATIEERVSSAGGGWLFSWKDGDAIRSELPDPKRFGVVEKFRGDRLVFYRITPIGK
jgi:hypothetical protein